MYFEKQLSKYVLKIFHDTVIISLHNALSNKVCGRCKNYCKVIMAVSVRLSCERKIPLFQRVATSQEMLILLTLVDYVRN